MKAWMLGICLAMLVVTGGCASVERVGRPFTRPQPETLVLGKTTYEEVIQQVGEPVRTETVVKNGQPLKVVRYAKRCFFDCFEMRLGPAFRVMAFFFLDDILVGYQYTSNFSDDKTDFDDTKAYQLKKGQTTRSQVIELLGKPSGMYIYPMISSKMDTALVYYYLDVRAKIRILRTRPEMENTSKLLVVSFDTQDLVTEAQFSLGDER